MPKFSLRYDAAHVAVHQDLEHPLLTARREAGVLPHSGTQKAVLSDMDE